MLCQCLRSDDGRKLARYLVVFLLGGAVVSLPILLFVFLTGEAIVTAGPRVENATLHVLELEVADSTAVLAYNLSAVVIFTNPGVNFHVDMSNLTATPFYGGTELGPATSLPSFVLPWRAAVMVPMEMAGRQTHVRASVAKTYAEDAARGYFAMEARLHVQEGSSDGGLHYFLCTLYFPAPSTRAATNLFDGDDCMIQSTAGTDNTVLIMYAWAAQILIIFLIYKSCCSRR